MAPFLDRTSAVEAWSTNFSHAADRGAIPRAHRTEPGTPRSLTRITHISGVNYLAAALHNSMLSPLAQGGSVKLLVQRVRELLKCSRLRVGEVPIYNRGRTCKIEDNCGRGRI